jgi:hypothetical protein
MSGQNVVPMPCRKKSRTSDIIAEAVDTGKPLPLEVLLKAMWRFLDDAGRLEASPDLGDQSIGCVFFDRALGLARDAAPFLHARLATTTLAGDAENPIRVARADPFARLDDATATKLLEALNSGTMTMDDALASIS